MNKFRKIVIGIVVAAGAACLGGAAGCNKSDGGNSNSNEEPTYYQLDLKGAGADIVFQGELAEPDESGESFRSGGKVKEGVDVRFTVLVSSQATGTPVVSLNSSPLADVDGVYSFTMEKDSTISVTGLSALYTLSFPKSEDVTSSDGQIYREERRIKFYDENDRELGDEVQVIGGSDYTFKLWVSPYYNDDFTVSCGFDVLEEKASDGLYTTYTVSEVGSDGEINVTGLTLQTSFANYENGEYGDGTAENPYQLSKPVDLFYLAAIVNDDYYGGRFSNLHYELTADIDMGGEQLYVIGDSSTNISVFSGTFNGNGHTISNFYITDEVYDQETYTLEYLPYVGLFGYAVATVDADNNIIPTVIKNVTLEDYTLRINPAAADAGSYAGSLLGWGIGAEVSGCKAVAGRITITNDNNQIVNAGGLVGRLQGAYSESDRGSFSRSAFIRSSSAEVSLQGTGSPHSAGGIVGYLLSADESAIAYVADTYSSGSVTGSMRAGGIVGTLGRFASVSNSYSTARLAANNSIEGLVYESFRGAYAGGIAGYAEENTVIAGCYDAGGRRTATSAHGANYAATGAFAGSFERPNADSADYEKIIEYGNRENVSAPSSGTFTALGWTETEWDFSGSLPTLKIKKPTDASDPLDAVRNINVKVFNGTELVDDKTLAGYMPMADWYKNRGGIPEYAEKGTERSWGYYFDAEMTEKVPYGFVPVKASTEIYVDYADYAEVAGTYYVQATTYSDGAYIRLDSDGTAFIRSGGLSYECTYSYNGKPSDNIIIYRSCLAALSYGEGEINGNYFAYGGTVGGGELSISSYLTLVDTTNTSEYIQYDYVTNNLLAVKQYDNFVYGEYKNESGAFYTFNNNGTGVKTSGSSTESFTFAPSSNGSYTLAFTGRNETATLTGNGTVDVINNISVSKIDGFKGSWKKFANSSMVFTFDGEGKVSLGGGEAVDYTVANGAAGFTINNVEYKATLTDGNLVINGENYFVSDNFTGEWYMLAEKEQISISLGGVGTHGYGTAVISYTGNLMRTVEAQYDLFVTSEGTLLRIYVGDRQYGELEYNASTNSASGSFYSMLYNEYRSYGFNIYDIFRGTWTGVAEGFDTVTFNGRSATADGSKVTARPAAGVAKTGTYTLTGAASGTMTLGGVTYNISYNEVQNKVIFTEAGEGAGDNLLARRDGWYGVVLYDGETSYTFDGKSELGGKVKVSDGTELGYSVTDGAVTLGSDALVPEDGGFTWGDKTLVFRTGFAGEWYVSATDEPLQISEVGGDMTATVSGEIYAYDPSARTLTNTSGNVVTVLRLVGANGSEINMVRTEAGVSTNVYCVRTDSADAWRGVYTAADGAEWKFDGLGSGVFCSGTATYTPADGEPEKYTYVINERGLPYITADRNMLFMTAVNGDEDVFVNGGNKYKTVEVDVYYGRTAMLTGDSDTYFFDGVSTVWVKSDDEELYTRVAYKYETVTSLLCELIDNNGVRYNGRVSSEGRIKRLTVEAQSKYTAAGGATYAFGWNKIWLVDGTDYTFAYTFTATETDGKYDLTDKDGKKYAAVVSGTTIEITAVEEETTAQA